jgi:hypothetical protein
MRAVNIDEVGQGVPAACTCSIFRVGQDHIYTVYLRYFWQGSHQIYGHIRRIYTVLANPRYFSFDDSFGFNRTYLRNTQTIVQRGPQK